VQVAPVTQPPLVAAQDWPSLLLQAPVESQVPAQRPLGSATLTAATQAWLLLQVWQVPVQSLFAQQPPMAMQVVVPPTVQDCMFDGHA
jgi:hypothetical protein